MKGGKPAGAYLSKGFTKYAFRVSFIICDLVSVHTDICLQGRIDSHDLAIFQCQAVLGSTEDLNGRDLQDELLLLGKAQYFLDTFYERAKACEVNNIPRMFSLYSFQLPKSYDTGILQKLDGTLLDHSLVGLLDSKRHLPLTLASTIGA